MIPIFWDVRVSLRQLVQDLCFSGCLKPNPSSSRSCHPITSVFLILRVSQHAIEPGPRLSPRNNRRECAAVMSRPERSSGRLSRPGSPRVCLTRPGLAVGMRFAFRVPAAWHYLLGRSIEQHVSRLLQLSCHPSSAFKLRRPFDLNFSSICLFMSVLLGAVSFWTVVLRIFLCRVRLTTVWILLASADPSSRCRARSLPESGCLTVSCVVNLHLGPPSEHCID